jgi:hypothetical protein
MSTAGRVDLELDQGADFGVQLFWTDGEQSPFKVLSPMRMEIRNETGQVSFTLQTDDAAPADATKTIIYNTDSGLIQLMIPATDTALLRPGTYFYDLFVTYQDDTVTGSTRLKRLIAGNLSVNGRVTRSIS